MTGKSKASIDFETWFIICAWALTIIAAQLFSNVTHSASPLSTIVYLWKDNDQRNWVWAFSLLPINLIAFLNADLREKILIFGGSAVAAAISIVFAALSHDPPATTLYIGVKLYALFGFCALAAQARTVRGWQHLLVAAMFSTFFALDVFSLNQTYVVRPQTLDEYTYAFDAALSVNPAWHLFCLYRKHHLFAAACDIAYDCVMVPVLILYAVQTRGPDDSTAPALRAFLVCAIIGLCVYLIFPVSGPLFFFGTNAYLAQPLPAILPQILPFSETWRNGMPSLHLAFVLLVAVNVPKRNNRLRVSFYSFVFVTAVVAMANGQHYVVDIVGALPFVCAIQALCFYLCEYSNYRFLFVCLRAFGVYAVFLLILLYLPAWMRSPAFAWSLLAITVIYSVLELRELRNHNARVIFAR